MNWRRYPVVERAGYHLSRARAWARRATAGGLAVRVAVWLTGLGAVLLALPAGQWVGPALPVAVLLALLPAAWPGSGWVAGLELVVVGIVAVTAATGDAGGQSLPWLLLIAALLYGHHTAAALGAQLRTDAVIPLAVLSHWAARAGVVLAASAAVGLGIAVLAGWAPAGTGTGVDTGYVALGAAAAVAVALAVGWLVHRRAG